MCQADETLEKLVFLSRFLDPRTRPAFLAERIPPPVRERYGIALDAFEPVPEEEQIPAPREYYLHREKGKEHYFLVDYRETPDPGRDLELLSYLKRLEQSRRDAGEMEDPEEELIIIPLVYCSWPS